MVIEDQKLKDQYYTALVQKDDEYVGIFYAGVLSTSIFCISTCRAKKPKKENVEFFDSFKSALNHGFRPCKICRPTQNSGESPEYVRQAIEIMERDTTIKVTDQTLRNHDLSPQKIRRWFKQNYGITFQAYQRMYRINNAFLELKKGKKLSDVPYKNGYDSLSGFGYTYKNIIGKSPKNSMKENLILIKRIPTPLGPMYIGASELGLCLLEFTDRRMLETELHQLQEKHHAIILVGENQFIKQTEIELDEYFNGRRKEFSVPLHLIGSPFQKMAWEALMHIPFGNTVSYSDQAKKIGKNSAVRAVANANGMNKIAIIVPCHRVIGKNGKLTGYGGGLERKRWLLNHEKNLSENNLFQHVENKTSSVKRTSNLM